MSSPTQLSQAFMLDPHMDEDAARELPRPLDESPHFDDMDFATELPDFYQMEFDAPQRFGHSKHFSVDGKLFEKTFEKTETDRFDQLLAPFSLNAGSRFNFGHLRNLSLDDRPDHRNYSQTDRAERTYDRHGYMGHGHSVSISADPPLGTFTHSALAHTLHLTELVPQLLLLALNQLLLDSPYLAIATTTPARRRKSASILSMYATPLRTQNPLPGLKVGKTPMKQHRRTRLKAAVEPGLAQLLATIANMKSSLAGGSHLGAANPFEMSFLSPKVDLDYDATPLATPAKAMAAPLYFTPISQNRSFGGLLSFTELSSAVSLTYLASTQNNSQNNSHNASQGSAYGLRRQDTMDLIKIEDQDDDACMQLRKAKLFTAFSDPQLKLTRIASLKNFKLEHSPVYETFKKLASIDLLLPELMAKERTSTLKSYPASIDLASITNSGVSLPPHSSGGLLPPIAATRTEPRPSISVTSGHGLTSGHGVGQMSGHNTGHNSGHNSGQNSMHGSMSGSAHGSMSGSMSGSISGSISGSMTASRSGSLPKYPTTTEIHENSASEEIAKFAEQILNSDTKRPIIVQNEENTYDPKKKHKCPLCLARFQRPEHVKRHLKSHSTDKPFQCDWPGCGRRFNRKDNLKAHLKKIHKQS